jgi:predicted ribosome quality control (RQC) complex YloA/Tae2 family protein
VRKSCESSIARIGAALEKLRAKETEYGAAEKYREYGDLVLANIARIQPGDAWLEADNLYHIADGADGAYQPEKIRIKLDPLKKPSAQAEQYYEQYRKARDGYAAIQAEITRTEQELAEIKSKLSRVLTEPNPLALARLLKNEKPQPARVLDQYNKRPGLSFRKNDWLIIVGRDAAENDALLRSHVKGNDLWLHVRDYAGSYVFVKQRSGKSVPLDILLDAGNLALFYSKGRNNGAGELYYTPVKYLRRAKNGPKGLVIPAQEKNLHITLDENRLKELENCRILKSITKI